MDNYTSTHGSILSNISQEVVEENTYLDLIEFFIRIYYKTQAVFSVFGTFFNLWFLVAILSSSELRSRLRNKIICNTLLFCLVDTLLTFPTFGGILYARMNHNFQQECYHLSLILHLIHTQDFINNWLIVSLIVVFIAQIQDFNPASSCNLSPKIVTVGTYLTLISPWLAAVLIVPLVIYTFHVIHPQPSCSSPVTTAEAFIMLKITDTVVPIAVAVLLLILAAVLKHLRAGRNRSNDGMQDGLIGASMKIDQTRFYVLAVGMCLICDSLQFLQEYVATYVAYYGYASVISLSFSAMILADSRVLLTPFVLLFLEDIRERIRTWRPWRRFIRGTLPSKQRSTTIQMG